MGIKIITGQSGEQHINSADDGAINIGMIGEGQYVLPTGNKLSCQKISNSIVRINDGIGINQGRFFCIPYGDYEDITIDNGVAGVKRCDLIVARYNLDADTAIETCEIVLIKGSSGTAYVVPSCTESNIYEGGKTSDMPLYKIMLNGTSIDSIECLFQIIDDNLYSAIKRIASNEEDIEALYTADSDIIQKISKEQIRAEEKESALQESINAMGKNFITVANRISDETDRAMEAESELDNKIDNVSSSGIKSINGKSADSEGKIILKDEDIDGIIMERNCCQTTRNAQSVNLFSLGTTLKIALTSYSDSKKYFDIGTYFKITKFSDSGGRIYFDRKLTVTLYKPDKTTVLGNITILGTNISKSLRALTDTEITGEDDYGYKIYLDSALNGYLIGPDEEVPPYISDNASKLNHAVTFKGNSELSVVTEFDKDTEIDIMDLIDEERLNVNSAVSASKADKISGTVEFTGPDGGINVELKKDASINLSELFDIDAVKKALISGKQTTVSTEDDGINIYTFTDAEGNESTIEVKNGSKGATGQRGSRWTLGTAITGTSTTATVFSGSGISDALVNDMYLNTSTGNVYRCTTAGAASAAKWTYTGNIKGATGDKGPQGDKGETGPKGDKGETGPQGPKGDKGDTGATGAAGATGAIPTIKAEGGSNIGIAGTPSVTANTSGTTTTFTFNYLKGAKGDTGATGAQGATGAKGDKGDTGAQGPKGDKGDTGATGATGAKGDKGDTGAQGPKGDTGPQGEKGDSGVTVPAGGLFTLSGDSDGNLWCYYADDGTAPEFETDSDGNIYYITPEA